MDRVIAENPANEGVVDNFFLRCQENLVEAREASPEQRVCRLGASDLAAHLKERGIGTMRYYPVPLHPHGRYASVGDGNSSLLVSEMASRDVQSLPMYPELAEAQQQQVAQAVREFYGG